MVHEEDPAMAVDPSLPVWEEAKKKKRPQETSANNKQNAKKQAKQIKKCPSWTDAGCSEKSRVIMSPLSLLCHKRLKGPLNKGTTSRSRK